MKNHILFFAVVLVLAIAIALAGCGGAGDSAALGAAGSAVPESSAATPAPEKPGNTVGGAAGAVSVTPETPETGESASLGQSLVDALTPTVRYEAGEAGTSLKGAIAACSLLDWAQDYGPAAVADSPDGDHLDMALEAWFEQLSPQEQEAFRINWPDICDTARRVIDDPESQRDLLSSAGIETDYSHYDGSFVWLEAGLQRLWEAANGVAV